MTEPQAEVVCFQEKEALSLNSQTGKVAPDLGIRLIISALRMKRSFGVKSLKLLFWMPLNSFCLSLLSGRGAWKWRRTSTSQHGGNVSGGWRKEDPGLSISQQAEICRIFLKVTSAQKALKLKRRIVILLLLTQMVSMIQP